MNKTSIKLKCNESEALLAALAWDLLRDPTAELSSEHIACEPCVKLAPPHKAHKRCCSDWTLKCTLAWMALALQHRTGPTMMSTQCLRNVCHGARYRTAYRTLQQRTAWAQHFETSMAKLGIKKGVVTWVFSQVKTWFSISINQIEWVLLQL